MLIEIPFARNTFRPHLPARTRIIQLWTAVELVVLLFLIRQSVWLSGAAQKNFWIIGGGFVIATSITDLLLGLYTIEQLGIKWDKAVWKSGIVEFTALLAAVVWISGMVSGSAWRVHPDDAIMKKPLYILFGFGQQFILQSYIFVRLERLVGEKKASLAASLIFCWAHRPNHWLMFITLVGGYGTNRLFLRYRNVYALGFLHGVLGAAIPSFWHLTMRVGASFVKKALQL